jgi:pimeloyl-ACP methyl ester carboxylesterase
MSATSTTLTVPVPELGDVPVTVIDQGSGRPFLLLHGGGGPLTVEAFAARLAEDSDSGGRVLMPIHPGFNGTPRPEALVDPRGLAALYVALLETLELEAVTVVGNSIGGWIAAEMAILGSPRAARYVILDGVGIDVPGHPVVDFFSLTPAEIAQHSYHDPERFGLDPSTLPPAAREALAANRATLAIYGEQMVDPSLRSRLGGVDAPALVAWGEADRIADPDYGRAYAEAIPGAEFLLLERTGHLPQIETPEALLDVIGAFVTRSQSGRSA